VGVFFSEHGVVTNWIHIADSWVVLALCSGLNTSCMPIAWRNDKHTWVQIESKYRQTVYYYRKLTYMSFWTSMRLLGIWLHIKMWLVFFSAFQGIINIRRHLIVCDGNNNTETLTDWKYCVYSSIFLDQHSDSGFCKMLQTTHSTCSDKQ